MSMEYSLFLHRHGNLFFFSVSLFSFGTIIVFGNLLIGEMIVDNMISAADSLPNIRDRGTKLIVDDRGSTGKKVGATLIF